jgi:enterochelin esterase-like enzyme
MHRQLLWRIALASVMAVIVALLVVALVPPWRDEALTTALLVTGQIGAPRDLRTVALCGYRRRGLGAWLARRIVVPRGRVVAGTIAGEALHGARRPYYAYLPPGYDLPVFRHRRYPVVYLLHGAPGTAHDWYWGGKINVVADRLIGDCLMVPMILVMPDGNGGLTRDSQYVNRWNGTENDETYIVRDVVGFVDRHYRTLRNPRFRAIMGLSEGGYGAANLTVRNPDVFGAAVAITGYLRADPREALFWDNPFDHDVWMMRANSPILRVATLPPAIRHRLHFYIYDGANDGAYAPKARAFVHQLARYGVPSYWDSRVTAPTGVLYHTWTYWRDSARDALIRLSALCLAERAQTD